MQKKELMNVNLPEMTNKTTSDRKDLGNHVHGLTYTNIAHTDRVKKICCQGLIKTISSELNSV